MAYIKTPEKKY